MYENLAGKIISFEGGEGAGKSTIINRLGEHLINCGCDVEIFREPGGNKISEQIRNVIVDKNNTVICPETECLLFAAARAQLLNENIAPLLNANKVIIFDRFIDSSYVYQGFVRNLGINRVKEINAFVLKSYMPNITFLLDLDPQIGLKRIADNNRETNRIDLEGLEFHNGIRAGYLKLAELESERIKVIDASASQDEVFASILKELKKMND